MKFLKTLDIFINEERLSDLYLLIKEMLRAKDETFGRKDLELFDFWDKLTYQIISLAEDEAKIKMEFNKERSNLLIPWVLESKLPEHQRGTLKSP